MMLPTPDLLAAFYRLLHLPLQALAFSPKASFNQHFQAHRDQSQARLALLRRTVAASMH